MDEIFSTDKIINIVIIEECKKCQNDIIEGLSDENTIVFETPDEFIDKIESDEDFLCYIDGVITDNYFEKSQFNGVEIANALRNYYSFNHPIIMMSDMTFVEKQDYVSIDLLIGKKSLTWQEILNIISEKKIVNKRVLDSKAAFKTSALTPTDMLSKLDMFFFQAGNPTSYFSNIFMIIRDIQKKDKNRALSLIKNRRDDGQDLIQKAICAMNDFKSECPHNLFKSTHNELKIQINNLKKILLKPDSEILQKSEIFADQFFYANLKNDELKKNLIEKIGCTLPVTYN